MSASILGGRVLRTLRQECSADRGAVVLVEVVGHESENEGRLPDGSFAFMIPREMPWIVSASRKMMGRPSSAML